MHAYAFYVGYTREGAIEREVARRDRDFVGELGNKNGSATWRAVER